MGKGTVKMDRTAEEAHASPSSILNLRDGSLSSGGGAPTAGPGSAFFEGPPATKLAAIDAMALREDGRGVSRSLRHLVPLLSAKEDGLRYVTLTTKGGRELLGEMDGEVVTVPAMPKSSWEQLGLPFFATKLGADVVFSRSECSPLWGPPVLLHVPEDPYVRWEAMATTGKEKLRRTYQRLVMRASLRRAPVVVASCEVTARALQDRFGHSIRRTEIVPLGVDNAIFYPERAAAGRESVFHLGSSESRDRSLLVVEAYALALERSPGLPDLLIAGHLGRPATEVLVEAAAHVGISGRLRLLGRISDDQLRRHYSAAAVCVQPSRYEGFGLQPLEALACGAPLVITPEAAVESVVGDAALVAPGASRELLAEAISRLWEDEALRAELARKGPDRAAGFTWEATADLVHRLLLDLARGPKVARENGYPAVSP
jgi:glycosyltransferase involved in cell wall biosynthesis